MNKPLATRELAADFRARFSADEFMEAIAVGAFADMKIELLNGELERMTPPMSDHSRLQVDVVVALRVALAGREASVFGEIGIRLSDDTVVAADAAIAQPRDDGNRMLQADEIVLAIEVASTTLARDLGAKRAAYAEAGVPNYWVVDVSRRLVHRFGEPTEGAYLALTTLRFGEPIPVPGTDKAIQLG